VGWEAGEINKVRVEFKFSKTRNTANTRNATKSDCRFECATNTLLECWIIYRRQLFNY
jgi:hypothetical protein